MRKIKHFLLAAMLISVVVFLSSTFAKAQMVTNYLFVEVVDSKGAPVKDATVQAAGYSWENNQSKEVWGEDRQTGADGKAQTYLPRSHSDISNKIFRVVKPAYFPYYDLGMPVTSHYTTAKIELLKIPTTREERKVVGNEQLKREFMLAVKNGDVETIRRLTKSGINPNLNTDDLRGISGPKNIPAIIFAAASGNNEMLEFFLKAKVDIRKKDEPVRSILAYYLFADRFSRDYAAAEKAKINGQYEQGIKMLIEAGAEFKRFPGAYRNATALMLAAQSRNINLVKMLLEKGVPINARNDDGETVLFYAPDGMFDFLLESGADPNLIANVDKPNCRSALMDAVWAGSIKNINALIAHKADVNFTCSNGNNALKTAKERKNYGYMNDTDKIIEILKDAGAKE